jgi:hypothetical protein
MACGLSQIVAAWPGERQAAVETRHDTFRDKVEDLREIRRTARADIASAFNIIQPSVSKTEDQADMLLSTLRNYVEAIAGQLEFVVRLPTCSAVRIHQLGQTRARAAELRRRRIPSRGGQTRHG